SFASRLRHGRGHLVNLKSGQFPGAAAKQTSLVRTIADLLGSRFGRLNLPTPQSGRRSEFRSQFPQNLAKRFKEISVLGTTYGTHGESSFLIELAFAPLRQLGSLAQIWDEALVTSQTEAATSQGDTARGIAEGFERAVVITAKYPLIAIPLF